MREIVAVVLTVSAIAAVTPQEIPRFKSGVDVVQFTVTVLDKDRHPVTGLTASDFDVLVDGKPRPLAAFAAVTLPGEPSMGAAAASMPSVAPDVLTNQLPPEGRLIVIVMDRSIPDGQPMQAAHAIANAAIDRLGPNDLGAVVYTGAASRKHSQGITIDRARLHAAANVTTFGAVQEPPAPPSLAAAIASRGAPQQSQQLDRVQLASEEQSGECMCGVCVLDALTALAKTLTGGMVRHKSILFVGSDIAVATRTNGSTCEARIHSARERLSRALDEANVTFNVVDPRGLEPLGESAENGGPAGLGEQQANAFRQSSLAVLPDYTGGRVVLNTNKPADAIGPIFDESRAYYVLAVARDIAASKDEDRHHITIAVKKRDVTVRTRNLYFAADATPGRTPARNAAAAALADLLPRDDFPVEMNLVPQFSEDGSPEIRVVLGVDSKVAGKLDVLIRAFDRVFTPVGTPITQRLDVPAAAVAGAAMFQWSSVLKPPRGDYEVRAAVATADGRRASSVIGYVDVPDVKKARLGLSGILVKSGGAATVRRDFAPGDAVGLSFQVAQAKGESAAVAVRYLLKDELGRPIADATVPHERAVRVAPGVDGYDIGVRLPAGPGRYVVTIEASAGRRAARREVPITVH